MTLIRKIKLITYHLLILFQKSRFEMWCLVFLLSSTIVAGDSGPEYSHFPPEEDAPSPLPGMLYPRESESREVIRYSQFHYIFISISKQNL